MRASHTCPHCGAPVRTTTNGTHLDPNPHPNGLHTIDTYTPNPTTTRHDTPDTIHPTEPFRYRVHQCPTPNRRTHHDQTH